MRQTSFGRKPARISSRYGESEFNGAPHGGDACQQDDPPQPGVDDQDECIKHGWAFGFVVACGASSSSAADRRLDVPSHPVERREELAGIGPARRSIAKSSLPRWMETSACSSAVFAV